VKKTSSLFAIAVAGMVIGVLFLAGCQKTQQPEGLADEIKNGKGLTVEIKNGTGFPEELAGTWWCETNNWEVILEKNGTVSWVFNPLGGVWMEPGKTLEVPMRTDRVSFYAAGPWKAVYNHKSSVFSIEIVIPFFEIGMGKDTLTGDSKDVFTGPIDPEKRIWEAKWFSTATYIVNTPQLKDHELEKENPNRGTVIFKKVDVKY
jgi:hypothetical protein